MWKKKKKLKIKKLIIEQAANLYRIYYLCEKAAT